MMTDNHSQLSLYKRILRQARPYWAHILGCLVLNLLSTPLALLAPLPLKLAVDSILGSQPLPSFLQTILPEGSRDSDAKLLFLVVGILLAITLLRELQSVSNWVLSSYTGEKLLQDFRAKLFRHAQRLSLCYHDTKGTTDSLYRIHYDTYAVQAVALNGLIPLVTSVIMLAAMIFVVARVDWQLALVASAVAPVLFILSRAFSRPLCERWGQVKILDSSAMSVVQETLAAVRVVKAFGREDHEQERFLRHSRDRVTGGVRVAFLQGTFELLVGITIAAGTAAALFIGLMHVRSGTLTLGGLLVVMAYLAQLYSPLSALSKLVTDMQAAAASASRAFALFDELPEVVEQPDARPVIRAKGAIAFRDVSFSYDGGGPILRDVSFELAAGARLGVSGATGAGKTTLVSLLMRFYDPAAGQILLDGIDLRDYKLADLRNQFALVLQDAVLFSASVAENIAYARPKATEQQIVEASRLANAHEFISCLPDGYQTLVGERGMRLSGGERQRISLARAFLKDAPILLLDEPTSSVDVKTETEIVDAMNLLMRGRTTIMIAHRLSTLDICDARLEIERGRIVSHTRNVSYHQEAVLKEQARGVAQ